MQYPNRGICKPGRPNPKPGIVDNAPKRRIALPAAGKGRSRSPTSSSDEKMRFQAQGSVTGCSSRYVPQV